MFYLSDESAGTDCTAGLAALLLLALPFSPVFILMAIPGYMSVFLYAAGAALFLLLFRFSSKKRLNSVRPALIPVVSRAVIRLAPAAFLYLAVQTPALLSADLGTYRTFELGSDVATVLKQTGTKPPELKTVHHRPALIQELAWGPASAYYVDTSKMDPVRGLLLRFYNGRLFQIVSTYDSHRIEGMSEQDIVEVISSSYGVATKAGGEIAYHSSYGEAARVLAGWEDARYSYSLVRTGDQTSFALIVNLKELDVQARAAISEAQRLDVAEAPQRALDLEKRKATDAQLLLDKARAKNKPNFRP